jgi:hypothetical protein
MSTLVELRPPAKLLDEAVWQAWLEKGRAQDRRSSAARMKAVKWVSIAGLLTIVGFWSHLAPYDVIVRFMLTTGAIVIMFRTIHMGQYVFAAVFAALALLYNPVVPVFSFSGGWQRAVVLASAVPFAASLAARNLRSAS